MKLRYRAQALADLGRIHDFIARSSPRAADDILAKIHTSLSRLKVFPKSGRAGSVEDTRELLVPRLPYIIVYREAGEFIDIIAVFHAAQDR